LKKTDCCGVSLVDVGWISRTTPNANAERFGRSIKEECLDQLIPIGERHFRRAVTEYVEHYHRERNHQGSRISLSWDHWRSTRQLGCGVGRGWAGC
jgi:hypothetical protein